MGPLAGLSCESEGGLTKLAVLKIDVWSIENERKGEDRESAGGRPEGLSCKSENGLMDFAIRKKWIFGE